MPRPEKGVGSHGFSSYSINVLRFLVLILSPYHVECLSMSGRRRAIAVLTSSSAGLMFGRESSSFTAQASPVPDALVGNSPVRLVSDTIGEWKDQPELTTKLGRDRIRAKELSPLGQAFFGDQELYYAPFLFGSWNVTATLKTKSYPYGTEYLPSKSLLEGSPRNREEQVNDSCTYESHYFSTLANTLSNQMTVTLGTGVPESKIIQDRAFNAISFSAAYKQLTPVQEVTWDYRNDPTTVKLDFGTGLVGPDMRPLGPRRTEIFINARASEYYGENTFCSAERSRSVTLVTRDGIVSDTEVITEFHKVSPDLVQAISRIAVYLSPNPNSREGVLWQRTGGKAVAFFDYDIEMIRQKETFSMNDGTVESRACVRTPKDVVQCQ